MSVPTEFDWLLIKMGDGATPTEVFTLICGIQDVTVNLTVNSNDRFRRDCTKPGEIPYRTTRATGKQMDVSGTGLSNAAGVTSLNAALGLLKNYKIEGYQDDGTDAGVLLGTFSGKYRLLSANMGAPRDGDSSGEVTLANHGTWTWTPAS